MPMRQPNSSRCALPEPETPSHCWAWRTTGRMRGILSKPNGCAVPPLN